jgi:Flp pilus assembly protein TadB
VGGVMSVVNPRYEAPLFTSKGGQIAIAFAVAMIVAGSLAIKKIIDIKV